MKFDRSFFSRYRTFCKLIVCNIDIGDVCNVDAGVCNIDVCVVGICEVNICNVCVCNMSVREACIGLVDSLNFLAGWYGACITCILLAFSRLFEMLAPRIAKCLFGGKWIYIWLAMPIIYIFFTFSQPSGVYNIKYFAYHFVPFSGVEGSATAKVEFVSYFN